MIIIFRTELGTKEQSRNVEEASQAAEAPEARESCGRWRW